MVVGWWFATGCGYLVPSEPAEEPPAAVRERVALSAVMDDLEALVRGPWAPGLQVAWVTGGQLETVRLGTLSEVDGGLELGGVSEVITGQLVVAARAQGHSELPDADLLTQVAQLERRTGSSYADLLDEWVTGPQGLGGTAIAGEGPAGRQRTGQPAPRQGWSEQGPVNGLTSSIEDLGQLVLGATERAEVLPGWVIPADHPGLVEQSGTTYGWFAFVGVDREAKTGVALVVDAAQPRLVTAGRRLLARASGEDGDLGLPVVAPQPVESLADCVGVYDMGGTPVTVGQGDDGTLQLQLGDGITAPMYPSGPDTFFVTVDSARVTCLRKAEGVFALEVGRDGRTVQAPRASAP